MNVKSEFVIMEHKAKRAGLHFDLRFVMPNSKNWASFAVRKGVSTEVGKKVLAVRTHDHSREEALITGEIESGYGAGVLKKWDSGSCTIIKYHPSHIVVDFNGKKIKGIYHFINLAMNKGVSGKEFKNQQYWLFKGKVVNEIMGMASRVPSRGECEDMETGPEYDEYNDKLSWTLSDYLKKLGET